MFSSVVTAQTEERLRTVFTLHFGVEDESFTVGTHLFYSGIKKLS